MIETLIFINLFQDQDDAFINKESFDYVISLK